MEVKLILAPVTNADDLSCLDPVPAEQSASTVTAPPTLSDDPEPLEMPEGDFDDDEL